MPYKDPEQAREAARKYRAKWRLEHPEQMQRDNAAFRKSHPGYFAAYRIAHRKERADYNRAWALAHPQQRREIERRCKEKHSAETKRLRCLRYAQNRDQRRRENRERMNRDYALHPEIYKERVRRRKALKLDSGKLPKDHLLTAQEWQKILTLSHGRCYWCRRKMDKPTQDHVIPLHNHGLHVAYNVVASCLPCNCSKGAKIRTLL